VYEASGRVVPPLEVAQGLITQLRQLRYAPQPSEAFDLHRPGHAPRRVERLALADQLAQAHALHVLAPVLEKVFEPTSYGFRPGRSRMDAIEHVRSALREGFTHVLESDIAQCFPSVDHSVLDGLLDQVLLRSDRALRHLLHQAVRQPWAMDGVRHERNHGLAQGAPLAPALTNLMLTELDRSLDPKRFRYLRYADDFIVLTRSRADAQFALEAVSRVLGTSRFELAAHKTHLTTAQAGFTFLGEHFGPHSGEEAPLARAAQRKPMVVTEPFLNLGVNGDALEVRRLQQVVGLWPLRRLSEILILERATLSTALLDRCAQLDIPLAVTSGYGSQIQLLGNGQRRTHEAQLAHAIWHHGLSDDTRLAFAKDVVDAKLHNQAMLVAQRRGHVELATTLQDIRHQAQAAPNVAALRGHEGHAAKLVFAWLQQQVVPAQRGLFHAKKRARGGPDALNALLNFLYFLLNVRVSGMVRVLGLNPYLGWLHDATDNYETLVYDLMEPFRPLVDRLALRLINRLELRTSHFDATSGQHRLSREAARHVVERFEEALGEKLQGAVLRELLWHQGRSVHNVATGKGRLWLYRWEPREALPAHEEPQVLSTATPL
jgi:CRISPR-associated endonuclease Cas1